MEKVQKSKSKIRQSSQHSPEGLYAELLQIANINSRFKRGQSDAFTLRTYEEEAAQITDTLDPEEDGRWPTPLIAETYELHARRIPFINDDGKLRSFIHLDYLYKIALQNIKLPQHIAEDAYGLDGQEAVDEGGPSQMEHTIGIGLNGRFMKMNLCESFSYADEEGDVLSHTCSCPIPHTDGVGFSTINPKISAWADHDNDDDENEDDEKDNDEGETTKSPVFRQSIQFNSEAARKLEVIDSVMNEEQALALINLHEQLDKEKPVDDIVLAYSVLHGMKRAIKRQLGVQFPS